MEDKECREFAQNFMSGFDKDKFFTHKAVEDIVYGVIKGIDQARECQ